MGRLWALLDPFDLDGTTRRWTEACLILIDAQRTTSAEMAARYFSTFRLLELGPGSSFTLAPASPLPLEAVVTSLRVTGPVTVKAGVARGAQLERAMATAKARSAGAAQRHTLDAGRDLISDSVDIDDRALGWSRATGGTKVCAFCALMASRGPVYKSQGTARFQPHDACHCTPEPVYSKDAAWPPGSRRFRALYQQAKDGEGDTLSAFRQLVESPATAG